MRSFKKRQQSKRLQRYFGTPGQRWPLTEGQKKIRRLNAQSRRLDASKQPIQAP